MKTVIALILLLASTGCVVVGGYSNERGWFIWPGTFVLLGITLLFILLFRRRR
jgi:fatty acid desaturase